MKNERLSFSVAVESMEGISYFVDTEATIRCVGQKNWAQFADGNESRSLTAESVLGRSIFDFIAGPEVRATYQALYKALISGTKESVSFLYRCDHPSIRREMRMCLTAVKVNAEVVGILHQSLLLVEQQRPLVTLFHPASLRKMMGLADNAPTVTVCSYCHDVNDSAGDEMADEAWKSPEAYYSSGGRSDVWITHGVCPQCYERVMSKLENSGIQETA